MVIKKIMEYHSSSARYSLKCIERLIIQLPESCADSAELIRCFGLWNIAKRVEKKKQNQKEKSKACLLTELPVTEMAPRDPANRSQQKTCPSLPMCWRGTFWGLLSSIAEKEILGKKCAWNKQQISGCKWTGFKGGSGSLPFGACKWQKDLSLIAERLACYLVYLVFNSKRE